jgi:hypothetical protein
MNEEWRQVSGYDGYEVSNLGRVRSWRIGGRGNHNFRITPRILKPGTHPDGYRQLWLSVNGVLTFRYVHHLVLEAFVGACPEGLLTRHLDGDPANNRLDNIVWGTDEENWRDQLRHGRDTRGSKNWLAKFTDQQVVDIRRRLSNGERGSDLARELDVAPSTISRIKHEVRYKG